MSEQREVGQFNEYRAKELASIGTTDEENFLRLVVSGPQNKTKHLRITATELEAIIAVLEPEDYKEAVPDYLRVKLPEL